MLLTGNPWLETFLGKSLVEGEGDPHLVVLREENQCLFFFFLTIHLELVKHSRNSL